MIFNRYVIGFSLLLILCRCVKPSHETIDENLRSNYVIKAELFGFDDGTKFYLVDIDDSIVDSAVIKDHKFKMQGKIKDEPAYFSLQTTIDNKLIYTTLLIKNEPLTIKANLSDFPWNVHTYGSPIDSTYRKALSLTKSLDQKRDSLIFNFIKLPFSEQETIKSSYLKSVQAIDSLIELKTLDYIKNNQTYASILKLYYYKNIMPKDSVKVIYDTYNKELKLSRFGQVIKNYLESNQIEIGDQYLDFQALDQLNNSTSLSDLGLSDKYILINYTSARCGFCIEASNELIMIHNKYKNNLNIVSFSADAQENDWKISVERDGNLWTSLWDGEGRNSKTAFSYNFMATPTFLLIDKEGRIIDRLVGYNKGKLANILETNLLN